MLSGQVPFPSPSLPEKLFGHQAVEPDAADRRWSRASPRGWPRSSAKMMRKSPDERYATPLEVAQALEPFTDEAPSASASGGFDLAAPTAGPPATHP